MAKQAASANVLRVEGLQVFEDIANELPFTPDFGGDAKRRFVAETNGEMRLHESRLGNQESLVRKLGGRLKLDGCA